MKPSVGQIHCCCLCHLHCFYYDFPAIPLIFQCTYLLTWSPLRNVVVCVISSGFFRRVFFDSELQFASLLRPTEFCPLDTSVIRVCVSLPLTFWWQAWIPSTVVSVVPQFDSLRCSGTWHWHWPYRSVDSWTVNPGTQYSEIIFETCRILVSCPVVCPWSLGETAAPTMCFLQAWPCPGLTPSLPGSLCLLATLWPPLKSLPRIPRDGSPLGKLLGRCGHHAQLAVGGDGLSST